jgi:hypothetical protein
LTPGGSSALHIYTQTIHIIQRNEKKEKHIIQRKENGKCGPCPVFASYTLIFALQLRKKHGKISVTVAKYKNDEQYNTQKKNINTENTMSQNNKEHRIHNRETLLEIKRTSPG